MENEKIIKKGSANIQRGIEQVGGKLYLTNERIIFKSHKFNFQSGNTEIKLENISSVNKSWTKFLGFIPLVPNSIKLSTKEGSKFRFVINGRSKWISAINKEINNKLTMKKLLLILLCLPFIGFGQCIKGDCENGVGLYFWPDGSYTNGSWKQST